MTMPPLPTLTDVDLRRKLYGRIVPATSWAIARDGQLCWTRDGRAHLYVSEEQARATMLLSADYQQNPKDYVIVQVVTVDRERCAEVAL